MEQKNLRLSKGTEIKLNQNTRCLGVQIKYCDACKAFTPQDYKECLICSQDYLNNTYIDEDYYEQSIPDKFMQLYMLISQKFGLTDKEKQTICPLLAAILTIVKHKNSFTNQKILNALEKTNTYLRQVIIIFIFFKIQKMTVKQYIRNKEMIVFFNDNLPTIKTDISDASFNAHVATAIRHMSDVGALQQVSQGCYKITI